MTVNVLELLYRGNSLSRNLEIYLANAGKWVTFPTLLKEAQENKMSKGVAASEKGVRIALTRVKHFTSDETGFNWRHTEVVPKNKPAPTPEDFTWTRAGQPNKGGWRGKIPTDARAFYHKALSRPNLRADVVDEARQAYVSFLAEELPGVSEAVLMDALLRGEEVTNNDSSEGE